MVSQNQKNCGPSSNQPPSPNNNVHQQNSQNNLQKFGFDVHIPVFPIAALSIIGFICFSLMQPVLAGKLFTDGKSWITSHFHWLFAGSANIFAIVFLLIGLSPFGKIRLGGEQATPEFSLPAWLSMLFAAGMGIGLMFWSVAEPIAYYTDWAGTPFNVEPKTPQALELAQAATLFHWGFHAWSIYGIVALSLAFFTFNKGLPLTLRSSFYPLLGDRVWGWFGHCIDIVAVLATIFGLATSLGFGAQQIASGLHYLFKTPNTITVQLIIIGAVTLGATVSVIRGLHGGVKRLSEINMFVALCLFIFVLIAGGFGAFFQHFYEIVIGYSRHIIPLSQFIGREDQVFYQDWTVFYWAWWIAWSPFIGMFIARVSKGRTIREFVTCVLIVPVVITALWFANFGGLALDQASQSIAPLSNGITSASLVMFQMLSQLPMAQITTFIAIVLAVIFFITSSDSGSLVVDSLTAGGKLDAPMPQRIFWAVTEGAVAGILLYGGGKQALSALQTASIITALPFILVLLVMMVSLLIGLKQSHQQGEGHKVPRTKISG